MTKPILPAILSCSGTALTDDEKYLFAKANPLGVTLFSRNIQNSKQLKKLVNEIKNVINRDDVLIAIDEEGGRVSRLKTIIALKKIEKYIYVSEEELGKAAIKYSRIHAQLIAEKMLKYGLNVNYSPIVEQKEKKQSTVLLSRCFSFSENKIIKRATIMADSYIKMGVCPCIKHLPGHFGTTLDPHLNMPISDISKSEIYNKIDYMRNFNHYPLAMTSHIMLSSIDNEFPFTMSAKCIKEILREYLGFENFLISDAIDMHALKGTIQERAENCLNAGIDAICYCSGKYTDLYNICNLNRFMTEKTQIKFDKIKKIIHNTPRKLDISKLENVYRQRFLNVQGCQYEYDATEVLNKMIKKGENL